MTALATQRGTEGARLIQGPVGRQLAGMTGSMLIGTLSLAAFNITDTYFVSFLGTDPLAAMSFTFPVAMIVGGLARGLGVGVGAMLSQKIGQGDMEQVRRLATHSLLLGLCLVGALVTVGMLTVRPLFMAMGATPDLLAMIEEYMRVWYPGMVFLVVPMLGNNVMRATGDTLSPSVIMTTNMLLNVALDPLFIFGLGPFPAMGIGGAALATVISRAMTLLAALYVLHHRKGLLCFKVPSLSLLWDSWRQTLHLGLPPAGSQMLMPMAMGVLTRVVAVHGAPAVAAFGVGIRVEMVAAMPLVSLALSTMPFVGQNWGARRLDRIYEAHRLVWRWSAMWGAVCVVALALAAPLVARIFSNDPRVIPLIQIYLWIAPVAFAFRGLDHVANGAMNAVSKPLHSVGATALRLFVLVLPMALVGGHFLGFTGVIGGLTVAQILSAFIASHWIHRLYASMAPSPPVVAEGVA